MAARSIASGTISFGLVSIPVKVFTATQSKTVRFNMLHKGDHSRLKQKLTCTTCGDDVERSDTVRGYEYTRGQYVVMSDEELQALTRKTDQSIEIEEFVPIEQVDPIFFERTSFLGPDKGGQKAYRLLHRSMSESGRVAVGRFSARGRQQLVLLRPMDHGLAMHGLYYADEVRVFEDVEIDHEIELKQSELDLAGQLIDQLTADRFEAKRYEDTYRQEVLEAIDRKVAGEEIVVMPAEEAKEQIIDLVAALKQSLADQGGPDDSGGRKAAKAKGKPRTKKATRKKSAAK